MAKKFVIKNPSADITPGQGRAIFRMTRVDTRTIDPGLNMGDASELLSGLVALNEAKKLGPSKGGVSKKDYTTALNGVREQLINAGGTDKQDYKRPALEEEAPNVVTRFTVTLPSKHVTEPKEEEEAQEEKVDASEVEEELDKMAQSIG